MAEKNTLINSKICECLSITPIQKSIPKSLIGSLLQDTLFRLLFLVLLTTRVLKQITISDKKIAAKMRTLRWRGGEVNLRGRKPKA